MVSLNTVKVSSFIRAVPGPWWWWWCGGAVTVPGPGRRGHHSRIAVTAASQHGAAPLLHGERVAVPSIASNYCAPQPAGVKVS